MSQVELGVGLGQFMPKRLHRHQARSTGVALRQMCGQFRIVS
jgi:hypothetical protein